ncbi:MAG: hypothetical protein HRT71_10645, partial [Flavobacteriales bacterium]|nr:hypothetical protein [Flavobacteriales bacterium]
MKNLGRHNATAEMDQFTYNYADPTSPNRLTSLDDGSGDATAGAIGNGSITYQYDNIGNLIEDEANFYKWNLAGKLAEVRPKFGTTGPHIVFSYDAMHNRVVKKINLSPTFDVNNLFDPSVVPSPDQVETTYYVRDATGNVMANYTRTNAPEAGSYLAEFSVAERPMYGSARLGIYFDNEVISTVPFNLADGEENITMQLDNSVYRSSFNNVLLADIAIQSTGILGIPVTSLYEDVIDEITNNSFDQVALATGPQFVGTTDNSIFLAENENKEVIFYGVTADHYGNSDVTLVYDVNGQLMKGTENINFSKECKPVVVPDLTRSGYYFLMGTDEVANRVKYYEVNMNALGYGSGINYLGEIGAEQIQSDFGGLPIRGRHFAVISDYENRKSHVYMTRNRVIDGVQKGLVFSTTLDENGFSPIALQGVYLSTETYGEGEIEISPNAKTLSIYNHNTNLGWTDYKDAEIVSFQLDADYNLNPVPTTVSIEGGNIGKGRMKRAADDQGVYFAQNALYQLGTGDETGVFYQEDFGTQTYFRDVELGDLRTNAHNKLYQIVGSTATSGSEWDQDAINNTVTTNWPSGAGSTPSQVTGYLPSQPVHVMGKLAITAIRELQHKTYELVDHLGNVRVVVSDNKVNETGNGLVASVESYTNQYAFGMEIPGRLKSNSPSYRYGFNGQEKDDEIKGNGNSYTAQYWQYDPRLGRRWNTDPVVKANWSGY